MSAAVSLSCIHPCELVMQGCEDALMCNWAKLAHLLPPPPLCGPAGLRDCWKSLGLACLERPAARPRRRACEGAWWAGRWRRKWRRRMRSTLSPHAHGKQHARQLCTSLQTHRWGSDCFSVMRQCSVGPVLLFLKHPASVPHTKLSGEEVRGPEPLCYLI